MVVHPYNGIPFHNKKELLKHAKAWMKLRSIMQSGRSRTQKATLLYDSIYTMTIFKRQNYKERKQISGRQVVGEKKRTVTKEHEGTFWS